VYIKILWLKCI